MGIEAKDFSLDLDLLAYSGIVFSPEQRAALQTSLVILKEQYKFKTIHLWGKILGITEDYFIIQGRQKDELKDRQFLYSLDCINWNMLTPASDDAKELALQCQGRFTGDPSHEFEVTKYHITNEDTEEENIEEYKSQLREEERLAATLWKIEQDALIIPRGSYILQPNGNVERNRTFEGLTITESGKLSNYFHFRPPIRLEQKSLVHRATLDKSLHFLDTIDEDIPKGWSVQYERGSGLVQIRCLKWIGMAFFHIPETNRFGSLYCGIGEENKDLPFMI
ncbi:unnamed protein product [Rotaria sp. Silwood2]|nr:unnamed protein product [Rotaria sp. Silwood2]CAF2466921.1 unnamed protein product [Rotaria sp. Silwood2]CAF2702715.1 unnamed protein product [Rotaria sp. Silwood2]CAF2855751.1 unnamed protein product [Rotaria sp. Silwood2]CAF3974404.1 unnamed protein product [Rotaria sp. Silwood2]